MSVVKIGVAGPVGSGKTALIEALIRKMHNKISLGVVTNDIYTKADSQYQFFHQKTYIYYLF